MTFSTTFSYSVIIPWACVASEKAVISRPGKACHLTEGCMHSSRISFFSSWSHSVTTWRSYSVPWILVLHSPSEAG